MKIPTVKALRKKLRYWKDKAATTNTAFPIILELWDTPTEKGMPPKEDWDIGPPNYTSSAPTNSYKVEGCSFTISGVSKRKQLAKDMITDIKGIIANSTPKEPEMEDEEEELEETPSSHVDTQFFTERLNTTKAAINQLLEAL